MDDPIQPPTQIPFAQPLSVLPYAVPPVSRKPVSVTVLGIIGIVFGSLIIMGSGASALGMFVMRGVMRSFASGVNSPATAAQMEPIWNWGIISAVIGLLVGIGLLVAAIAFLRLAFWGLRAMVIYAIVDLTWQLIKIIVTVAWLIPYQTRQMAAAGPGVPTMAFSHFSTFIWIAILCAFPVVVLVFSSRQNVREAFATLPRQPG